jgi:hypothetical protein
MVLGSHVAACHISSSLLAVLGTKLLPTSQPTESAHARARSGGPLAGGGRERGAERGARGRACGSGVASGAERGRDERGGRGEAPEEAKSGHPGSGGGRHSSAAPCDAEHT